LRALALKPLTYPSPPWSEEKNIEMLSIKSINDLPDFWRSMTGVDFSADKELLGRSLFIGMDGGNQRIVVYSEKSSFDAMRKSVAQVSQRTKIVN